MNNFRPKSFHLQWHITERCNLSCKHCYQDTRFLKKEISADNFIVILDKFIEQIKKWKLKKTRISITGGEPLIRSDFFYLIEKIYENKSLFLYGILTNGTFLNEKNIKKLENLGLGYVQISLEGMEKINDSIRGKGVFKKAVNAAKLLRKTSIALNFSMTITKANLKDVPNVINLSKKIGIPLGIRRCIPCGSGKQMKKAILSPKEVRALWHYILKVKKNFWQPISLGCEDDMLIQDFNQYQSGGCSAGYASFTVLPNADVYPCRRLPIFAGNLLKQSFEDIYYNSDILKKLRNRNNINDACYQCPWHDKCNGGAKCLAFGHFEDFSAPDPHCWRLFDKLPKKNLKWNSNNQKKVKINDKRVDLL